MLKGMTHTEQHISVKAVVAAIGRSRLQESLGVHKSQISGAIKTDQFHANWFVAVSKLAKEVGIKTDSDAFHALFRMRKVGVSKRVRA